MAQVRDGDIWISEIPTSREHRITNVRADPSLNQYDASLKQAEHRTTTNLRDDLRDHQGAAAEARSAGIPSYIVQEEFGRNEGYWWRPPSSSNTSSDTSSDTTNTGGNTGGTINARPPNARPPANDIIPSHAILYEKVDESNVQLVQIQDFSSLPSSARSSQRFRIPPTGTTNANVELWIASFRFEFEYDGVTEEVDGCGDDESCRVRHLKLPVPLRVIYPWCEYIVRSGWTPDGNYVWAQLLDREQLHLAVIMIPVVCFVEDTEIGTSSFRSHRHFRTNIYPLHSERAREEGGV